VRSRGGNDDRVGAIGDDDVPDPLVGEEPEHVLLDRMPAQCLERERRDELRRRRREQADDVCALGLQRAHDLRRLVGSDGAGDTEADEATRKASA
jgi:hypothetical protein